MRALKEHRSTKGWGTFLRTFARLLTHQVFSIIICRGSSTSTTRRRLHYRGTKASSILLYLPDPKQMEEFDTVSYPAS